MFLFFSRVSQFLRDQNEPLFFILRSFEVSLFLKFGPIYFSSIKLDFSKKIQAPKWTFTL